MEGKAAVLGSADFVMPFSALGLDTFPVEPESESVSEAANKILKARYMFVVVAENVANAANEVFEPIQNQPVPAVVIVPFTGESQGFATQALGKVLKMATGIDIFAN